MKQNNVIIWNWDVTCFSEDWSRSHSDSSDWSRSLYKSDATERYSSHSLCWKDRDRKGYTSTYGKEEINYSNSSFILTY